MNEELEKQLEGDIERALKTLECIYPEFNSKDVHNVRTPHRIAKMWVDMFKGLDEMDFEFTKFPNDGSETDWVILKDIEFASMCQHHFMPFSGVVHIGYKPYKTICGISKLARVVDYFASRPQVQERLGKEIYDFLNKELSPCELVVIIESRHTCVGCRGIKSRNSKMITTKTMYEESLGEFKELIR